MSGSWHGPNHVKHERQEPCDNTGRVTGLVRVICKMDGG